MKNEQKTLTRASHKKIYEQPINMESSTSLGKIIREKIKTTRKYLTFPSVGLKFKRKLIPNRATGILTCFWWKSKLEQNFPELHSSISCWTSTDQHRPAASASPGTYQKCIFLGPTLDLLGQKLSRCVPETCSLTRPSR